MGIRDLIKPNIRKLKESKDVPGLINALEYKSKSSIRKAAAEALGKIGDKSAIKALKETLSDNNVFVRAQAAKALGEIRSSKSAFALIRSLKDPKGHVRTEVATALGKIGGDEAISALVPLLRDDLAYIRKAAATALVKIGPEAVDQLIESLEESNHQVHKIVVNVLGAMGPVAFEKLRNALSSPNFRVRGGVANALYIINKSGLISELMKLMRDSKIDTVEDVVEKLKALGYELSNEKDIDIFMAYLKQKGKKNPDSGEEENN